jgi:hypothetical protein
MDETISAIAVKAMVTDKLETLQKQREQLKAQNANLVAALNATEGGMLICQQLLATLEEATKTEPNKPE